MDKPIKHTISVAVANPEASPVLLRAGPRAANAWLADEGLFFRTWLQGPVTIGAVIPTRATLARAMSIAALENADRQAGQRILELGGGTGPLTRALLARVEHPHHVAVLERNPTFHRMLSRRFPRALVMLGDAENLETVLPTYGIRSIGAVVSSLPRVGWSLERQRRILTQCFELLGGAGVFLEFSYGPFSPVPRALIRELHLTATRVRRVWWNFPPATIWSYRRR